jgi:uncharacterized SAM-dependent methyltransferase
LISSKEIKTDPRAVLRKQLSEILQSRKEDQLINIELDRPFNLYLVEEQAMLYLDAIKDELFVHQLYGPFLKAIEENINRIFNAAPKYVDFIDLGPGYPNKSAPLIQHFITIHSRIRYIPVDISQYFLDTTVEYFKDWGIDIIPLNLLFEELPETLTEIGVDDKEAMRVVNIGFTFNNFNPDNILNLLKKLFLDNTVIIIATQIIDDTRVNESLEPYRSNKADKFNFKMLELLGFNRKDFEYAVRYTNHRIEMGYFAKCDISLDEIGTIKKGDHLVTSISYRYEEKSLIGYLKKYFSDIDVISDKDTRICIVSVKEGTA